MGKVIEFPRRGSIDADKTEAAEHTVRPELGGEELIGTQSVLEGQEERFPLEQRAEERREMLVGSCLHRDDDEVTRSDFPGAPTGIDLWEAKVAVDTPYFESIFPGAFEV